MAWIIESQLDTWLGKTLLALVAVAMFSATLAIQASASRVMFSMARDNRLPFGKFLSKVNKRTGTPVITGIAVSTLAILVLLVNIGQSSVFAAIASVSGRHRLHRLPDGDRARARAPTARHQPVLRPARSWTSASGAFRSTSSPW